MVWTLDGYHWHCQLQVLSLECKSWNKRNLPSFNKVSACNNISMNLSIRKKCFQTGFKTMKDMNHIHKCMHWSDSIGRVGTFNIPVNNQNQPHGVGGVMCYKPESFYEGGWISGKKHGIGNEVWSIGTQFEGCFQNDLQCGRGVFR